MKKPVLLFTFGCFASLAFGQNAQIVFNNTAFGTPFMVFNPDPRAANNPGTYLVIDNPSANALWYQPSNSANNPAPSGQIRSEAAQNKIRWAVNNSTGLYVIPYGDRNSVGFPLRVNVGSAPSGNGSFVFSTYNYYPYISGNGFGGLMATDDQWDNTGFMAAAGITHMNDFFTGSTDNSKHAVNRFWIIDAGEANAGLWTNWATKPTVTMEINDPTSDIDNSGVQDLMIANSASLQAQRFNTGTLKWGDYQSQNFGSTYANSGSVNKVSSISIGGANFFRAWTLSSEIDPLPIELTSWRGECLGHQVKLTWTTATEHNNDYFTVEKSKDGQSWSELGRVHAAGNSTNTVSYIYMDENADGMAYYRLSQTDLNGDSETFDVVAAGCSADNTEIVNAWDDGNDLNVVVSSTTPGVYDLFLMDAQGKIMLSRPSQAINHDYTTLKISKAGIATGPYVVSLQNATNVMTRRVMLY